MDIRNVLSLSGVLLVLGGVGYFWGGFGQTPAVVAVDDHGLPDYEVQGIHGQRTDLTGSVTDSFQAESLRHYPEPDRTELRAPVMILHEQGHPRWRLSADSALSHRDNSDLSLHGNVRGESLATSTPLTLETASLLASRDRQTLSTEDQVVFRSGPSTLSSQGIRIDVRQGVLQLPAHVRGTYVLPSSR